MGDPWQAGQAPVVEFYHAVGCVEKRARPGPAYCVNATFLPKPELRDEFLAMLQRLQSGAEEEDLCSQCTWGESVTSPGTFHLHQEFSGAAGGKEGYLAHLKTPHHVAWEKFVSE